MKLHSIPSWIITYTLAILPIFFVPTTQDYYDANKWFLLLLVAISILALALFQIVKTKHLDINTSSITRALGGITIASFISLVAISPNKIEALLNPYGPLTFTALTIISFLSPVFVTEKTQSRFRWALFSVTSIIAILSVYEIIGLGKIMFPNLEYLANPLWTPTGGTITTVTLFVILLPLMLRDTYEAIQKSHETKSAFLIIMCIALIAGLGMTFWELVNKVAGTLLPIADGWAILLEILKNPKNALLGVGAENFLAAFSAGRLTSYNVTPLWMARFTTNANLLFHLTTVYGLLGGISCIYFFKNMLNSKLNIALRVSLILTIISFLLTPPSLTILIVTVSFFLFFEPHQHHTKIIKLPIKFVTQIILGVLFSGVVCILMYFLARAYSAEIYYYQSLKAAKAQNGTLTYNLQIQAIRTNPNISRFHIAYAQTNVALATTLAQSMNQPDPALTPEEKVKTRDLVAQMIQQSIRESKLAVKLNPNNILAWENLARVYQQLIDVAQGADNWTITTFKQAILVDPNNPVLHLELGSVFVKMKDLTSAITQFQKAISLKPNYANAYYNLANAYKLSGDIQSAIEMLKQTQKVIPATSSDYAKVSDELAQMEKGPTGMTPTPSPVIIPPLSLPPDSGPGVSR